MSKHLIRLIVVPLALVVLICLAARRRSSPAPR